ncbi:hypothetical protein Cme02nite_01290 [Catellatospora methionotrophica]|uniref:Shikimate kinase n=1 Tax=Catellatospora methionotrophica TaxID=121620 RepID=A0A8J3L474_9ACTN|nr:hypothetical protein [Catellatospora methionotrophica]GIG11797.1 hypothetical protein Cme02nite_01290 [Catellatospora methionotrophica]
MHSRPDPAGLPRRLSHVYWIGGSSGSGKSTAARRLAARYGLGVYDTDAAMPDHARRLPADTAPRLSRFAAMDMDDRWVNRTPHEMLQTFHWYHGEGFEQIIADLLRLPADRPVVAEGFRLLPELVKPLLADQHRAVWLLGSPSLRKAVFDARGGTGWGFIAKTSDPRRALDNLLQRDAMFTDRLARQTTELGLTALATTTDSSEEDFVRQIAATLGLDR